MQQLEAHEVSLHKVFSSDYDFRIPDYQRPYAWDVEQAVQLLSDLEEALERGTGEPYFLGSVVLVKTKGDARAEVIDGQQRLTTLTILLSVLRDLAEDPDLRSDLGRLVTEPGDKVLGLAPKPRLTLRERDAGFFRTHVQAVGSVATLLALDERTLPTDAQKSVLRNTAALHRVLGDWPEKRRLELVRMLGERTFLVVVSTPDLDSAHRIFSVMNSRGLDLSPTDIFKARIIGALGPEESQESARRWEDAEEALGREDFADLFLHLRMVFAMRRAERELLREFQDQVLSRYLADRAGSFVNDVVVPYADAYARIRDADYKAAHGAAKVNAWFRRLQQIDNNDWRPAALWALRHHENDPVWLDRFLRALERLAASMFVRRVYTTPRVTRYAELMRELDAGHGPDARSLVLTETEKADTRARLDGDLYLATKTRKYVLLRLDEMLAGRSGVSYDHPVVTVEHVLPQNPKAGSRWQRDFTDEQRAEWTHRLANLVLLNRAKNSYAQNHDFAEKKAKYFTGRHGASLFALTSQVLHEDKWTPDLLRKRQRRLLGLLAEEWDL
ncbi:DUF262 domain-containing HNH endonuclease family protein [Streptacidiphilus sp. ASG 303]|uniref:DUF262 domain-containing protein n=1 Tax=Streptacidiphilus sp. ASG 303 TaxID=2896847 RepID=UPI001E298E12|nr:DUF262 domain-containing protein [Streptacidiphilus sp. ASG 303]MCD0483385.1 DUF262 domain-containing HNH endonuclease family protein [Streptacidiphilus sp. ASG 303]